MARISKYAQDITLNDKDLLTGSNYISGSLGEEVYNTTNFTLGSIKSYIEAAGGAYSTFTRTLTGSELVDAFNGNNSDSITLVSIPANKLAIIREVIIIVKASSTGTTNYNANTTLYVMNEGGSLGWGTTVEATTLNSTVDYIDLSVDPGTTSVVSNAGGPGADIILGTPSSVSGCTITQGDRDVVLSIVYKLVDF
jgi:hypothetical protein